MISTDESSEITQQDCTNAAIGYFFLAPLFLLAKRNPNFAHPFVRVHAKSASKLILAFVVLFVLYKIFLSRFAMDISIPFILVDADRVISIVLFAGFFFALLRGARRAFTGRSPNTSLRESLSLHKEEIEQDFNGMSDTDKLLATLSFIPFFGVIIARKHPNLLTLTGEKCGALFAGIYLLSLSSGSASLMIALFVQIVIMVSVGVLLFTEQNIPGLSFFAKIPDLTELYQILRTTPIYLLDILRAAFGRKQEISFKTRFIQTQKADILFQEGMENGFAESEKSPFGAILTAIPFLNIIFFPSLCMAKSFRLVIAVGQGIVVTVLLGLSFWWYGFFAPETFIFLFPIFLLLANAENNAFYRIPVIYELYTLVWIITFGLTNRARRVGEISKKEESVSYKV